VERANRTELRHGVAINRITGAVQRGPFDQEMVPAGVSFWGEIALENYQVWQLGLLATAFDEIEVGIAQLGSAKSRGLGVARVEVETLVHEQGARAGKTPNGLGALVEETVAEAYGLLPEGNLPEAVGDDRRGLVARFTLDAAQAKHWLDAGRSSLTALEASS
jgi:CRISPR/Cas system CSM-associated protein Csm3 (group 7 of RAMP superfamily)